MTSQATTHIVNRLGYHAAVATAILASITLSIAVFTPPLSGPGCTANCFIYPYHDIASRFPRDYYWMYIAILLSLVYFVLMTVIHHAAREERKVFSHIGLSFALVSTAVLVSDYFLQVSVVPPSLANSETDGIAMLSQFNAHGVFIVLEEIGFTMMSVSALFMAPAIVGKTKVDKWIRWIFIGNFLLAVVSFVLFSVLYGIHREYRYEIAVISINWVALIATGILLAVRFRRAQHA
jgi:hypothetical protein